MFEEMNEKLSSFGVVPVVVLNDAEKAVPLAKALLDGGLGVAEVTFRTAQAEGSSPFSAASSRAPATARVMAESSVKRHFCPP